MRSRFGSDDRRQTPLSQVSSEKIAEIQYKIVSADDSSEAAKAPDSFNIEHAGEGEETNLWSLRSESTNILLEETVKTSLERAEAMDLTDIAKKDSEDDRL